MHDIIVKCTSDSNLGTALLIAILTVLLTSPLILTFYNWLFSNFEKRFKYAGWVAVFLTNEQVYFGKIRNLSRHDSGLENIFYLDQEDFDQETGMPKPGKKLIKLGNEIHGPKDFMLITRQHVLFLENLTESGLVVSAIKQYELQNKKEPSRR